MFLEQNFISNDLKKYYFGKHEFLVFLDIFIFKNSGEMSRFIFPL